MSLVIRPCKEEADKQAFIEEEHPEHQGFELRADDVVFISLQEGFGYSRIPQARLVEAMHANNPEAFERMLRLCFDGKIRELPTVVAEAFGEDVVAMLRSASSDVRSIIAHLQESPSKKSGQ
jgi:hypothetical protein